MPIVPDAFYVPESPPPSFSEALQLSVAPVSPPTNAAVDTDDNLSPDSNSPSSPQAFGIPDIQANAPAGDDDETSKFYIAWEQDREAGFSLHERVRRDFERRKAAELAMPARDPSCDTVNSDVALPRALALEMDCHPTSSQVDRALTPVDLSLPNAMARVSFSSSSEFVTEPSASRPLPMPPPLSSDVPLPTSAYVSLLATKAQSSTPSSSLTTFFHPDSNEPTTRGKTPNYFVASVVSPLPTISNVSAPFLALDDPQPSHEYHRLASDSPAVPDTPFITTSEPETASRLNRKLGVQPSGPSLEAGRKPDDVRPQSAIRNTLPILAAISPLATIAARSSHAPLKTPPRAQPPMLHHLTSPPFPSKLTDRTSPPSSFTFSKSRPRSPAIGIPQSPTKSAGELEGISPAVRDRITAFEGIATRTRLPPSSALTPVVPPKPLPPPAPGRGFVFPISSPRVIKDAVLSAHAHSKSPLPNEESDTMVRLDGDHPSASHPASVKLSSESGDFGVNEIRSIEMEHATREPTLDDSTSSTISTVHGSETPRETNASTSTSVLVNLRSTSRSFSPDRHRASSIPHPPAASTFLMDPMEPCGTSSPQIYSFSQSTGSQLNQGALPSPSTHSHIQHTAAASPSSHESLPPTNLPNSPSSPVSLVQATTSRPQMYSELTDLDLLVARLDSSSAAANSGLSYDDLLTISSIIGPAQSGPTSEANTSLIEDLPVAHVEVERRRKTKDGRTKLKLSLMGIVVDRCGVCLSQFKKQELGVLLPCHHS